MKKWKFYNSLNKLKCAVRTGWSNTSGLRENRNENKNERK